MNKWNAMLYQTCLPLSGAVMLSLLYLMEPARQMPLGRVAYSHPFLHHLLCFYFFWHLFNQDWHKAKDEAEKKHQDELTDFLSSNPFSFTHLFASLFFSLSLSLFLLMWVAWRKIGGIWHDVWLVSNSWNVMFDSFRFFSVSIFKHHHMLQVIKSR